MQVSVLEFENDDAEELPLYSTCASGDRHLPVAEAG
jgi:hypothetical protein